VAALGITKGELAVLRSVLVTFVFIWTSGAAFAVEAPPSMRAYVESQVMGWVQDPVVIDAVRAQNGRTVDVAQAQIDAWDLEWRAQVGQAAQPLVKSVLDTPASAHLQSHVAASNGQISEVFVMDQRGLNVAASGATSDYWQGDEAKFQKTYPMGAGAIFVDEIELDESTQTYSGQISVTLVDPDTGAAIGAVTVGLNAEMFF
jgi:hypothetical protein